VTQIVVVTGNPKPASRTLSTAAALADGIAATLPGSSVENIDLATVAGEILGGASDGVRALLEIVADADIVIAATPVYKASFTGLLKAFLDLLPSRSLAGAAAVPLTLSGSPAHLLVADWQLRPVLMELGASRPTAAFAIDEQQLPTLQAAVDGWLADNGAALRAVVGARASLAGAR
jgi:FMN reductase